MIEIILALIAIALLIRLIYHNKSDKKVDIRTIPITYRGMFDESYQKLIENWAKELENLSKKRRHNVSKKRKIRINKTKKTRVRKS